MSLKRFIIPEGNPSDKIKLHQENLRNYWDEAGLRRERFVRYKKALRKFHLKSIDSDEVRALLQQVHKHDHVKKFQTLKFS